MQFEVAELESRIEDYDEKVSQLEQEKYDMQFEVAELESKIENYDEKFKDMRLKTESQDEKLKDMHRELAHQKKIAQDFKYQVKALEMQCKDLKLTFDDKLQDSKLEIYEAAANDYQNVGLVYILLC